MAEKSFWVVVTPTLLNVIAVLPTLVAVTVCGALFVPTFWLPKFKLVGESFMTVALPVNSTNWGCDDALSMIVIRAVCVPAFFGLYVALIEQLAPAAIELPQESFIWNAPTLIFIKLIESAEVPLLVSFNVCCGLVVLIGCTAKASGAVVGEKLTIPVFSTVVVPALLASAKSGRPSPFKSPTEGNPVSPDPKNCANCRVPSPFPRIRLRPPR